MQVESRDLRPPHRKRPESAARKRKAAKMSAPFVASINRGEEAELDVDPAVVVVLALI